jgi:hypothetical protein
VAISVNIRADGPIRTVPWTRSLLTTKMRCLFQHLVLHQLRGSEWECDYSQVGEAKSLLVPSMALILAGNLQWDHTGCWKDANGQIQIQDPWWWSSQERPALICRSDFMDRFLEEGKRALIILGFQMKFIAGAAANRVGQVAERTLFVQHQGATKLIRRKLVRD